MQQLLAPSPPFGTALNPLLGFLYLTFLSKGILLYRDLLKLYDNINTVTNFTNQTIIIGPDVIGSRHNTLQSARQELTEMLLE